MWKSSTAFCRKTSRREADRNPASCRRPEEGKSGMRILEYRKVTRPSDTAEDQFLKEAVPRGGRESLSPLHTPSPRGEGEPPCPSPGRPAVDEGSFAFSDRAFNDRLQQTFVESFVRGLTTRPCGPGEGMRGKPETRRRPVPRAASVSSHHATRPASRPGAKAGTPTQVRPICHRSPSPAPSPTSTERGVVPPQSIVARRRRLVLSYCSRLDGIYFRPGIPPGY